MARWIKNKLTELMVNKWLIELQMIDIQTNTNDRWLSELTEIQYESGAAMIPAWRIRPAPQPPL